MRICLCNKKKKKIKKINNGEAVIMGVKRDNVPFAGGERGGRSPPNKAAKEAKRTFADTPDLLTLKQSNPPPPYILNMSRQGHRNYSLFIEVCLALGSVSPDQPQSELRRFATLLGDSVPSCTPAKGTLSHDLKWGTRPQKDAKAPLRSRSRLCSGRFPQTPFDSHY